jgi:hypothetical protein
MSSRFPSTRTPSSVPVGAPEPTRSRFNLSQLQAPLAAATAQTQAVTSKPKAAPTQSRFNLSHLDVSGASVPAAAAPTVAPTSTRTFGALSANATGSNPFGNRTRAGGEGNRGGERTEFSEQAAAAFGKKVRKSDVPEHNEAVDKMVATIKERNTLWSQISQITDAKAPEPVAAAVASKSKAAVKANPKTNAKKSKKNAMDDDLLDYIPTQHTDRAHYVYNDDDEEEGENKDADAI